MKRRRWLWLVVGSLLLLTALDAAAWLAAQRALAAGVARWAAAMAVQGVAVTTGPAAASGFPLRARRGFALRLAAGGASVDTERVVLALSPWQADRLGVTLPLPVRVAAPFLPPLVLAAAEWRAAVPFDGAGAETDARDMTLDVAGQRTTAALLHLQARRVAAGVDVAGSAQSITLPPPPPGMTLPLGQHVASLAFEAVASGQFPAPAAGSAAWPNAAALAAWRDSLGRVAVQRLALGYGPLGVSGAGTVGLDAALQPQAEATLTVLGYAETLDALVAAHVIDAHAGLAAGAVLGLLARPPAGGGALRVTLPVALRAGVLTAAGFPLLRLPPVVWPGARGS